MKILRKYKDDYVNRTGKKVKEYGLPAEKTDSLELFKQLFDKNTKYAVFYAFVYEEGEWETVMRYGYETKEFVGDVVSIYHNFQEFLTLSEAEKFAETRTKIDKYHNLTLVEV